MLFILFQIGEDRYALEASRVVEVIPLLGLKKVPQAPRGVAGLFNYRGEAVPALDLSEMTTGEPAAEQLSTRIIILRPAVKGDDRGRLIGLIAEHATSMLRKNPEEFVNPGITPPSTPYLGPVLLDDHGVIQWVQEQKLLPEQLRRQLFAPEAIASDA
jgi:chemotaxis-related protein WspB